MNETLLKLAQHRVWADMAHTTQAQYKQAVVPPGGDPAAAGGAPMDPAAMGGAPMDPAMGGVAPPGMAGPPAGIPASPMPVPTDPAAMAGMAQQPAPAPAPAPVKQKAEDWLPKLDTRLYNLQQQLSAIMNSLGVNLPTDSIILPPGAANPPMEAALPQPGQAAPPQGGPQGGGDPAASPEEFANLAPIEGMGKQGASKPQTASDILRAGKASESAAALKMLLRSAA